MITGAKGVGKSTLLRYMTNRLLSNAVSIPDDECDDGMHRVAILDTDVGQPELAPPGLLRLSIVRKPLLQPPYWNLVVSSVFFGATTSKVDPTRFMNAVQFLIQKYETEIVPDSRGNPIPLLVNMDGWVKGMGYQILTALVESLHPTHLV
eukprot:jgi/Psemu1/164037/gw1.171.77.1